MIRARKAVVSNASIWDTQALVPHDAAAERWAADAAATPAIESFMHLHLGIDAEGLPPDLECHHLIVNDWADVRGEQNVCIASIPTVFDASLAPPGKAVVHAYTAANEPWELWEGVTRGTAEYAALKKERAEVLWRALERVRLLFAALCHACVMCGLRVMRGMLGGTVLGCVHAEAACCAVWLGGRQAGGGARRWLQSARAALAWAVAAGVVLPTGIRAPWVCGCEPDAVLRNLRWRLRGGMGACVCGCSVRSGQGVIVRVPPVCGAGVAARVLRCRVRAAGRRVRPRAATPACMHRR